MVFYLDDPRSVYKSVHILDVVTTGRGLARHDFVMTQLTTRASGGGWRRGVSDQRQLGLRG
jgi:hypothetical protein